MPDEEHDRAWCNSACTGIYEEWCGDERCNGCIPTCCNCKCHKGTVCVCGNPY